MTQSHFNLAAALSLTACLAAPLAADETRTVRVDFDAGTSGTTITDTITGRDTVHYLLGAGAGQTMTVSLRPDNASTYMNVFAPGDMPGQSTAMFRGDVDGDTFSGVLPADGDYLVQVYLFRNAAREGQVSRYDIVFGIE